MLYDSKQWIADIDRVLTVIPELEEMKGQSIFVTGASGLICSAVVDVLLRYNDVRSAGIRILAAGRNIDRMRSRFGSKHDEQELSIISYDACKGNNDLDFRADYIIHGAGNAYPSRIINRPVETMTGNFEGMKELLNHAVVTKAKRILYISSSEVYGRKNDEEPYSENEHGYVDLLNFRNSYAVGKMATETLCVSYAAEYGVDTVIIRPGHIYGPTASESDDRVASQWVFKALRGEDIVMKSDGKQLRSYCYCLDCASAILKVLLKGERGTAYNVSNPHSVINIKRLAEIIAEKSGVRLVMELPDEIERKGFNPMSNSSLDSSKLRSLGWEAYFDADEGIDHTIGILRD